MVPPVADVVVCGEVVGSDAADVGDSGAVVAFDVLSPLGDIEGVVATDVLSPLGDIGEVVATDVLSPVAVVVDSDGEDVVVVSLNGGTTSSGIEMMSGHIKCGSCGV